MQNEIPDNLTLKEALPIFFAKYHFSEKDYTASTFIIKFGPVSFPLPNTEARKKAVPFHDLHHIITDFRADMRGECQIAAWEIASGCGKYYVAWFLNILAFYFGPFLFLSSMFQGWKSGLHTRTNLYHGWEYNDQLLSKQVSEMRFLIFTDTDSNTNRKDVFTFIGFCIFLWAIPIFCFYSLFQLFQIMKS